MEQARQFGLPIPDRIKNAPSLMPGLEMYMTAFNRLSTCRQIGMGLGPIPWNVIGQYANELELDEEHRFALYYHVEALDSAFLNWSTKQITNDRTDRHSDQRKGDERSPSED